MIPLLAGGKETRNLVWLDHWFGPTIVGGNAGAL